MYFTEVAKRPKKDAEMSFSSEFPHEDFSKSTAESVIALAVSRGHIIVPHSILLPLEYDECICQNNAFIVDSNVVCIVDPASIKIKTVEDSVFPSQESDLGALILLDDDFEEFRTDFLLQ